MDNEQLRDQLNSIMNNDEDHANKSFSLEMRKVHLFAYCELEQYEKRLKNEVKDYTIYWAFRTSKRRITYLGSHGLNMYRIHINNYETGNTHCVDFSMDSIFPQSFSLIFSKIKIKITSNGFYITFLIPESCINCITESKDIEKLEACSTKSGGVFLLEKSVYQLIRILGLENEEQERVEQLDLLYIGKSNSERAKYNIFSRLKNHSTISKIERERTLDYPNKETLIMLTSFRSNFSLQIQGDYLGIKIYESNWEKLLLIKDVYENKEMILLLEAILINYFKPSYNKEYIEKLSSNYRIYIPFKEEQVTHIVILLKLFYEDEILQLKTDSVSTKSKYTRIDCMMQSNQLTVSGYDLPEEICEFLLLLDS